MSMKHLFHSHVAMMLVVLATAAAYLIPQVNRGWIPHDEGLLGQTAERVLEGEFPHRDFDDPYTGGLATLHAAAFRIGGVRLESMRWMLFAFSLLFIPAVYALAARFATPLVAAAVTWLAVAWTLPNYFASLPSWYNLFFAVFGTLALTWHVETGQRRWLFVAGLCGGLSFLVKTIGLFYIAAALLFLVYREQQEAAALREPGTRRWFMWFTTAGLLGFCGALAYLVFRVPRPMEFLHFGVPGWTLCAMLWNNERQLERCGDRGRWSRLVGLGLPFLAGALLPVALFLAPYVITSSIGDFLYGVFVLPQHRFEEAAIPLPAPPTLIAAVPLAILLLAPWMRLDWLDDAWVGLVTLFAGGAIVWLAPRPEVYQAVWNSVRPIVPIVVAAGCLLLGSRDAAESLAPERRQHVFLMLCMAAMVSLVQSPYAFAIYFCYAAPAVVLAVLAFVASQPRAPARTMLCVLAIYGMFGMAWLNRGYVRAIGTDYVPRKHSTPLGLERGDLRVSEGLAAVYRGVVAEVQRHSLEGSWIYATQDCPEVYFLAERRNPTHTFYDVFDRDFQTDPPGRAERILSLLNERNVEVVVIRWIGEFSGLIDGDLAKALTARYPNMEHFGVDPRNPANPPYMSVLWREGTAVAPVDP